MTSKFLTLALLATAAFAQNVDRGVELYRSAKFSEAESEFRKAVEQEGDNARANRYLGLALIELGKSSDAQGFIDKANAAESNGEAKAALARLYAEQKKWEDAERALDGADGDQAAYARGLVDLNKKRYESSSRSFESFLEQNPEHAYAHYYAGMAYNGQKRPDKMLTHFEMFVKMRPDAPEARKVQSVLRGAR